MCGSALVSVAFFGFWFLFVLFSIFVFTRKNYNQFGPPVCWVSFVELRGFGKNIKKMNFGFAILWKYCQKHDNWHKMVAFIIAENLNGAENLSDTKMSILMFLVFSQSASLARSASRSVSPSPFQSWAAFYLFLCFILVYFSEPPLRI